jgi:hypothetical protein
MNYCIYSIAKPARIVGIFRQTALVTSIEYMLKELVNILGALPMPRL